MVRLPVAKTTHTVEVAQLEALNDRLATHHNRPRITAADLELPEPPLPGNAVLVRICWEGPPEYPYIHGHFRSPAEARPSMMADLHTQALTELTRRLHVRQQWGA
jgi:hypothetical protein